MITSSIYTKTTLLIHFTTKIYIMVSLQLHPIILISSFPLAQPLPIQECYLMAMKNQPLPVLLLQHELKEIITNNSKAKKQVAKIFLVNSIKNSNMTATKCMKHDADDKMILSSVHPPCKAIQNYP